MTLGKSSILSCSGLKKSTYYTLVDIVKTIVFMLMGTSPCSPLVFLQAIHAGLLMIGISSPFDTLCNYFMRIHNGS